MTRSLEEALGLPPIEEEVIEEESFEELKENECVLIEEADVIVNSLKASEKIDHALSVVSGLSEHDVEMDDIAKKAIKSYEDLALLGMNVADAHAGRIFEVAGSMLKTALEAKDAKVNRKLKTIELQMKKAKLDFDMTGKSGDKEESQSNAEFDRNELLEYFKNGSTESDSE